MKILFDELLARFLEITNKVQEGDEEMPYLSMGYLVEWLEETGQKGFDSAIVQRLVDFAKWCESQPRGETASDDIWTMYVVALLENLLLHEHTKSLIPHLTSKTDLEADKQYLVTWVGRENCDEVLEQFQQNLAACNEQYGTALKRLVK
jgi:hypothetical protein